MDIPLPSTWAEARTQLLPVLRRSTEPANAWQLAQSDPSNSLLRQPFAPYLSQLVVLDLPEMRVYINNSHLELWGVDAAAVYAAARENLLPAATTGLRRRAEYDLLHLDSGDGYESSRLLLAGWLSAFTDSVEGDPLAIVPSARLLMIGGTEAPGQAATLLDIAWQGFRTAGGPLSPVVYTVDGYGQIVPWRPGPDCELAAKVRGCEHLLAGYEYSEQRDQLVSAGRSEAIPTVTLVRSRESGESYTSCRWVEADGEALLPQTDRVVMVSAEEETEVLWEAVERHAAGCLEPTELMPKRYRARWPMPKTYESLKGSQ